MGFMILATILAYCVGCAYAVQQKGIAQDARHEKEMNEEQETKISKILSYRNHIKNNIATHLLKEEVRKARESALLDGGGDNDRKELIDEYLDWEEYCAEQYQDERTF